MRSGAQVLGLVFAALLVAGLGRAIMTRLASESDDRPSRAAPTAAVAVAPVERGSIALQRTLSGTLEAGSRQVVAPKTAGRVRRLAVDLADSVTRGQEVATLDDEEHVQAEAAAAAELAVAEATVKEVSSALEIATRELLRAENLHERGVASPATLDTARSTRLAAQAALEVAQARVRRDRAELRAASIRRSYTSVRADWAEDGGGVRVVAQRHVDEGDMVAQHAPLFTVVALDPLTGVVFVTEQDYRHLRPGQPVTVTTDARAGEHFVAEVARIAPVFRKSSRQARVELRVPNPDRLLNPGMFIRARIELDRADDATIVPEVAITSRDDQDGVFVVSDDARTVRWQPVHLGYRDDGKIQVLADGLSGRVVTLGHQLLDDGSAITIPPEPSGSR